MQLGNYVHGVDTFSRVGIDIETESSDGSAALNRFRFPVLIKRLAFAGNIRIKFKLKPSVPLRSVWYQRVPTLP